MQPSPQRELLLREIERRTTFGDRASERELQLGRTIRILRAERDLSQEELGLRGGLHRNYVGAIERGEINPTYRVLLKVAQGLAMPLSDLLSHADARLSIETPDGDRP